MCSLSSIKESSSNKKSRRFVTGKAAREQVAMTLAEVFACQHGLAELGAGD